MLDFARCLLNDWAMANSRYLHQRQKVTPPHVSIGDLRRALGLTLDQVCERVEESTGIELSKGGLSGIENGHRGASGAVLEALAGAYGLAADAITTDYRPRERAA